MKTTIKLLVLILFLVGISSCATLFNGSNQQISISSEPINATVIIDEKEFGKTPIVAHLSRKDNHIVKIELEGFEPEIITLNRKTSNWFLGNCLIGGLIGMGIDALSGGMYRLEPEEINAVLESNDTAGLDDDVIILKIALSPKPGWEKIGQLKSRNTIL